MTGTLLERALTWEKAKAALDAASADERVARDALLELDFADRVIGTNSKELSDGRVIKCVAAMDMKTDAERAKACVAKLEALGDDGKVLADRLFKWTPEVRVGELKKLPTKMRKIADRAIDPRPARPSIKIETPSG